jgi:hypothetical protein
MCSSILSIVATPGTSIQSATGNHVSLHVAHGSIKWACPDNNKASVHFAQWLGQPSAMQGCLLLELSVLHSKSHGVAARAYAQRPDSGTSAPNCLSSNSALL